MNDTAERPDRRFWATFALCAIAACVPLWAVKHIPMVDLPQHAAQISIWQHLDDPAYGFTPYFEMHYTTPYLLVYALVRLIAQVVPLLVALKVVVTIAVLGLPLSLIPFFRAKGVSVWWSLVGFTVAFGHSFVWGFLNFLMGLPIAFLYLTVVERYGREPTLRRGLGLAAFSAALFAVHGLLVLWCPALAGLALLGRSSTIAGAARRLWPVAPAVIISVLWRLLDPPDTGPPVVWDLGLYRLAGLFSLVGYNEQLTAPAYVILAGAIVLLRRRGAARAGLRTELPCLVLSVAALFLWPAIFFAGTVHVAYRFAVFWPPFLIAWLRPEARPAVLGGVVAWTLVLSASLTVTFRAFDRDARQYEVLAEQIPPRSRLRPLIFREKREDVFLHFPVWTQAEKGGLAGFSFASHFTSFVRYRPGAELMKPAWEWWPARFNWRRELPNRYDVFVVRSHHDRTAQLFTGAPVELVARNGFWWLYRTKRP